MDSAGYRTDVKVQLGQVDAFFLPPLNEKPPLALLATMATGMLCIAADSGGIPQALEEGCGVLATPGDVRSLRRAMDQLLEDPLLEPGSVRRRKRAAERFSLARCADDHVRLWSDILGKEHG